MYPPPPPPLFVVAAPPAPAPAPAAAGNARRPAGCWWQPVVSRDALTRAQIGMAAAAAAFALFASTLKPADFPDLPAQCVTTATEAMELRFYAGMLLLCAMTQAGAATAALVIVQPSVLKGFLAGVANLLGFVTLGHLIQLVLKALSATGGFCGLTGHLRTVVLIFFVIPAYIFLFAVPFLWFVGQ